MLAIDPTSPFTGGAILGDRVRMQDHATDDGVFIRSMATRGHVGGLALAVPEAVRVLAAVGWPWMLIETVGVGQVEVEIAGKADTCVVVVNPGWGDCGAGQQGRADGDRRRLRDQQGRPRGRDADPSRSRADARPLHGRPRWHRRSCRSSPPTAMASSSSGPPSPPTASRSRPPASWPAGASSVSAELHAIVARRLELRARQLTTGERSDRLRSDVAAHVIDPWTAADEMLDGVGG